MSPDFINGAFEFVGAGLTWMSIRNLRRDRGYAGIYLPAIVFFMSWGLWNLFYYPHLGQWWSFAGGAFMVVTNIIWIALMWFYGPIKKAMQ